MQIHHPLNCQEDLILVAKTGRVWAAHPSAPPSNGICLTIKQFSLLEEDQAKGMQGCAASVLNAATNGEEKTNKKGEYTHLLTSPKIALPQNILPILCHEPCVNRLVLAGVGGLHVVQP
jgi:hypothetical protein